MDSHEESAPDTASACKRQKRNNSDDESCSEDGNKTTAANAAAAVATEVDALLVSKQTKETVNSHNGNGNNNNNKQSKLECQQEQQTNKPIEIGDAATKSDSNPVNTENVPTTVANDDSMDSRNLVLPTTSSNALPADSSVDEDAQDVTSPIFNRPRTLRTRSYRSTLTDSNSSSSSSSSNNSDDGLELFSGSIEATVDSDDDDDDDNEETADAEGEDDDDEEAAAGNDEDNESQPSADQDESSSELSVAFWDRYYTSSNEEAESDDDYNEAVSNPVTKERVDKAVSKVMCKAKPSYNWNFAEELMRRESNLFNRIGWRGGQTSVMSFGQGYYGSRQVVESMKLSNTMSRHRGCVNSLNFNRSGDLICSGSDDLSVIVWDWANGKPKHSFKSGHCLNIFQTKFIDSTGCLDIVSSSRDGLVRRAVIPPSGGPTKPMPLYSHKDAVHKLVVVPQSRHEIISAGEDAAVKHFDLRGNKATTMLRWNASDTKRRVRLFSIAHHPFAPEFCICGSDESLRVYDKRKLNDVLHDIKPQPPMSSTQITCAVYNHSGSEILASYSDAGIFLYDSKGGELLHSYEGHVNTRTIKGVNFFGPHSEYIVSGSDCGHIFFWDKNTEAVINFMKGDHSGVVNCLEPHPSMPVLATSGLEYNVKIWTPSGRNESEVPSSTALKETLQRNFRRSLSDGSSFDINQIQYFIRQLMDSGRNRENPVSFDRVGMEDIYNIFGGDSNSAGDNSSSNSSTTRSANPSSTGATDGTREQNPPSSDSDDNAQSPLGCRPQ